MITVNSILEIEAYLEGLKAVVFDLDDTLYPEKEYVKSGYKEISKILSNVQDAEAKLWRAFEEKKIAIDEALKVEGLYTEELKQKCLYAYRYHQPNIRFYEGVAELLMRLRKNGYRLGVITDGRVEGQRAKIKALRLEDFVDFIIVTDELGGVEYRKPNERAFHLMKRKLDVQFAEMCYIGDNIKKDFIAPQKLGMRAIYYQNKEGLYFDV